MMVLQMSKPQKKFNKSMTRIQHDRMLSVKVNFHQPSESTRGVDETMRSNKRSILSNAAALLNEFIVKKILSFSIKGLSLNQELEMTLGFVKLNRVGYAAVYGTVTLMIW